MDEEYESAIMEIDEMPIRNNVFVKLTCWFINGL